MNKTPLGVPELVTPQTVPSPPLDSSPPHAFSRAAAALAIVIASLALAGWLLEPTALARFSPGGTAMNPLTAASVLLGGAALWGAARPTVPRWARAAALLIVVGGMLRLVGAFGGPDARLDQILFGDRLGLAGTVPNRMAPNTAICLLMLGASLALVGARTRLAVVAGEVLAVAVVAAAMVTVTGYLYGGRGLYAVGTFIPMALPTATALLVLGVGTIAARPEHTIHTLLTAPGEAGRVARFLLPASFLVPAGIGWLRLFAQRIGLIGLEVGVAVFVVATALTSAALVVLAGLHTLKAEALATAEHASRERLAAIVEASDDAIVGMTLDGTVTSWNRGAERLYGYASSEAVGRSVSLLAPSERPTDAPAFLRRLAAGESIVHYETEQLHRNGTRIHLSLTLSPVRDEDGRVVAASAIARDVTEEREAERGKEEFMSVVSHELRTPLTSIRGSLGLLASGRVSPDQAERLIRIADQNAGRLTRLVNDFLDFERIRAGRLPLETRPVAASDLVAQAFDAVRGIADQGEVRMESDFPEMLTVRADADRVVQVLVNLVSNAVKFSSAGSVVVVAAEHRGTEALFQVRDRGRGIPSDKLEMIFERFRQADSSDARAHGGTGLGLAIARGIVQQHGGRIWAASEPGKGSTFFFTLPLA